MRMGFHPPSLGLFAIIAPTILVLGIAGTAQAQLPPGGCVNFESLLPGTTYNVPATFSDSGVNISTGPFEWGNGTWTSTGFTQVDNSGLAGGAGNDMEVNNITLEVDFGRQVENLQVLFGEYGGNINLTINGDFRNVVRFSDLDGQWVGGTFVKAVYYPGDLGELRIWGDVQQFSIGGQELWIDDLCEIPPANDCIEFEELPPPPHSYFVGDSFVDSGVHVNLGEFFWFPSGSTVGGSCQVSDSLIANGSGQEVNSNNINLTFDFGSAYGHLSLLYTDLGGNNNLRINGVWANVADLNTLHMTTLGGAMIFVLPPGTNTGELVIEGAITDFAFGGQEVWLDRVCIADRILFSDDFESGDSSAWTNTVP